MPARYSRSVLFAFLAATLFVSIGAAKQHDAGATIKSVKSPVRRTGILFPRLVNYPNQKIQASVNSEIDSITRDFGCETHSRRTSYEVKSNVTYARRDVFSIYASAAYFCGGPYPTNDSNVSASFDLHTGKRVGFEELFENYDRDKDEILKLIFAPQVANSEKLTAEGKTSGDDCNSDPAFFSIENLESSTFNYNLASDGLHVQPEWPHAIEACAIIGTVPYSLIEKYAAKDGILARAAK